MISLINSANGTLEYIRQWSLWFGKIHREKPKYDLKYYRKPIIKEQMACLLLIFIFEILSTSLLRNYDCQNEDIPTVLCSSFVWNNSSLEQDSYFNKQFWKDTKIGKLLYPDVQY